ncbi:PAS domain-containing sensor histidine kinase [Carboxylicivirga mesophila]|uniref:histidine kinase n=1 Tax=Carboxylicivirga mesophila TaxID=1166478 RepID=A0ABS5KC69_9BACT|nr:PAS domain-containing sensor histidine kinase [Carboxylicivirga mesophila]MBS2212472.1 PAS domain-containing sensor histidine kinase [Carboxylicivirga mesophila]
MTNEELTAVYNPVPLGICVLNRQKHIVFVNKGFRELLNDKRKQVEGWPLEKLFPVFEQSYFKQRLEQVFNENVPLFLSSGLHGVEVAQGLGKKDAYCEVSLAPLIKRDDHYAEQVVLTVEEVTSTVKQIKQQKNLLKCLRRQLKESEAVKQIMEGVQLELQEANAAKDKLFSIIGHDLKTPFSALVAISDLLMNNSHKDTDGKERRRLYEAIWLTATQGIEFVTNLLNWAQSQSNSITALPCHFDMDKLLSELQAFYRLSMQKKSISIRLTYNTSNSRVFADMDMIKVVLQNLLSNAIKFSRNTQYIEIELAAENGNRTRILVKDKGLGMPAHILKSIMRKKRVKPGLGANMEKGTGIGLSVCHEFLEANNSALLIESTPGKGSTFSFSLANSAKGFHSQSITDVSEHPN